jgi:hypothetical protein
MMMTDIDLVHTQLVRPDGKINARLIGAIGQTGSFAIRYWLTDPVTARKTPVQTAAQYCHTHCICFLATDYPDGCPECEKIH